MAMNYLKINFMGSNFLNVLYIPLIDIDNIYYSNTIDFLSTFKRMRLIM